MSTLQSTQRHTHNLRGRAAAGLLALSALVAVGVSILFLALPGSHRATPATAATSIVHSAATPPPVAAGGYFRDPATHALLRSDQCNTAQPRFTAVYGWPAGPNPCYSQP